MGMDELEGGLSDYPTREERSWLSVSCFITPDTLRRLGLDEWQPVWPGDVDEELDAALKKYGLPTSAGEQQVKWTAVRSSPPHKLVGEALTRFHVDGSDRLELLIGDVAASPSEVLAELQLSFLHFQLLHSMTALLHWRQLVQLLCTCTSALRTRGTFFRRFIALLQSQLARAPADFFSDDLAADLKLQSALSGLLSLLSSADCHSSLRQAGRLLRAFLKKRFALRLSSSDSSASVAAVRVRRQLAVDSGDERFRSRCAALDALLAAAERRPLADAGDVSEDDAAAEEAAEEAALMMKLRRGKRGGSALAGKAAKRRRLDGDERRAGEEEEKEETLAVDKLDCPPPLEDIVDEEGEEEGKESKEETLASSPPPLEDEEEETKEGKEKKEGEDDNAAMVQEAAAVKGRHHRVKFGRRRRSKSNSSRPHSFFGMQSNARLSFQ
eukprot:PLAT10654.2.p1 GENE.PLAT10654.2~~PLAT10654.2.p1  ORF type:complete len:441 (-),score=202.30 PLAT10654.2:3-1325(-)